MGKIVGVRFQRGCKVYDFDAGLFVLNVGEKVIVDTEQGQALGEVVRPPREAAPTSTPDQAVPAEESQAEEQPAPPAPLKSVYRLATEADLVQLENNVRLEKEAHRYCLERVAARQLDMNLVKVEALFDRSKIIFYFTAEGRLDFRELVRDLVGRFRTRIEMRQIGVRHEAKLLGGLGSCGRELCCATFLKDFEPVSVKMAKEQNLSLNPTKISGLCGRLMCCLTYEFKTYKGLKSDLPKLGKRICLDCGAEGKVVRQNVLKRQITVQLEDGGEVTGTPEELAALKPEDLSQPKAAVPAQAGEAKPAAGKDNATGGNRPGHPQNSKKESGS